MYPRFAKTIILIQSCLVAVSIHAATISQEKQQQMTPEQALVRLKDGNQRFLSNTMKTRDYLQQAKQSSYGQFPFATVLNCMDSRSVPEIIFDQGLADLFTIRVAGNVINDDIIGSMEFATKVVGSRLIIVLGHTSCGAVAGACEGVKLGHLTDVLNKIHPAVQPGMKEAKSENCKDPNLINTIAKENAIMIAKSIEEQSPIIKQLIQDKQLAIVAGIHDIKTGKVEFFNSK